MHVVHAFHEPVLLQPTHFRNEPAMKTDHTTITGRRQQGFTLIEVMIVVAIVAILSAIALPSYSDYVKRGQIVDGLVPLADMGAKLEQYFQDKRTYEGACQDGTVAPKPTGTTRFEYDCPTLTKNAFIVKATGKGSMAGFSYSLDQNGVRSSTVPSGWTAGEGCWSTNKGGSC